MYKIFLTLIIFGFILLQANSDFDMDGVEDSIDKCPNTAITDLVDINGCTIKSLVSPHHFDIIFGVGYSQQNNTFSINSNTITTDIQIDYYYKDFSIQASTSYYNSSHNNGMEDSSISMYYTLYPLKNLNFQFGIGAILPTYNSYLNNNKTDYITSLNISYMFKNLNIFMGYNYTLINDNDTIDIKHKNTNTYNIGLGFYPTPKLYVSGAFNSSDSIYQDVKNINTLSIYTFYTINENYFITFNYSYEVSTDTVDNYFSLKIGYYF